MFVPSQGMEEEKKAVPAPLAGTATGLEGQHNRP